MVNNKIRREIMISIIFGVILSCFALIISAEAATIQLTANEYPVPASIVSDKSWVSPYYPSEGVPIRFTNSGAQNTKLMVVTQGG